ncbi:MAG: Uma2 family endonuclease [Bryobacteraceae bacterium]|nr:Uma2 family endonuclease [Bryobacteraceae bacterium]
MDVRPEDNSTSCPEPDFAVLSKPVREFRDANPGPADIVLAVKVSYSTVAFDLRTKGALYARDGIADYWVLDIPRRKLIVLREPLEGAYRSVVEYSEGESVAPLAAPDSAFPVTLAFE